jgi:uncharacterized Zn-binding protein involved in type VI secretion
MADPATPAQPTPTFEESRLALEQRVTDATGIPPDNPVTRAVSEMAGVGARYMDNVEGVFKPPTTSDGRGWDKMSKGEKAAAVVRKTQQVAGTVMGATSLLQDMIDVGFANLTAPIADLFPEFPAATLTMLYVGLPHAHSHPPSLIPPAPPVPLPSLGSILFGTCVKVLIGGMPAARSGDIGLAPTCMGFAPFFQIYTGSSNVFIGGARAARMLDVCKVCGKGEGRKASKIAVAVAAVGMAADLGEEATESSASMVAAKGLAATMDAAQLAADAAAIAMTEAMGTDPCIPPVMSPPSMGMVTTGMPTVLIGGFPMPNLPNPASALLNALKRLGGAMKRLVGLVNKG